MFKKYVSNTSCATGTSYLIESTNGKRSYRVYVKPLVYGKYEWRFFFINAINSTFAQGELTHPNLEGGEWKIHSALIGVSLGLDASEPLKNVTPVTYDGKPSKNVKPNERFWSDAVDFEINEGYLVWEWELEGECIPSMPDELFSGYSRQNGEWEREWNKAMPCLFGCARPYKKSIAFLGDSITAGCGTKKDGYEMWVGRIAEAIKDDYPVWNLGLGFGRGSDCATDGCWLYKAKGVDVAVITYGVNDILSGQYGRGRGSSAGEILEWAELMVDKLKEADTEVIISTIPPFSYTERQLWEWRCANLGLRLLAQRKGCPLFDIASSLETEPFNGDFPHGDHPNGEGCRLAYEEFKRTFFADGEWKI